MFLPGGPRELCPKNEKICAATRDLGKPHICIHLLSISVLLSQSFSFMDSVSVHSNKAGFFRGDAHKMGLGWLVPGSLAKSMCFIGEPNCLVRLWDTAQRA